jgi:hemerythrin
MLYWRKAFHSTLHLIDAEHAHLFELFNRLEAQPGLKRAGDLDEVNRSIDELLDYAVDHCTREEQVMRQAGYPGLELHTHHHAYIREAFIEVLRPLTAGEITLSTFVRLIRGQFIKHFMRDDLIFVKWQRLQDRRGLRGPGPERRHFGEILLRARAAHPQGGPQQ